MEGMMRDGFCQQPPKFGRDAVLEYLERKRATYRENKEWAEAHNAERFLALNEAKYIATSVILSDIAAMQEEDAA
jgi:hypothetical protein